MWLTRRPGISRTLCNRKPQRQGDRGGTVSHDDMARTAALRASVADREAVAERLRQATVEGRLEPYELEERLHAALRARTYEDLRRLVADLPGPSGTQAPFARTAFDAARMGTQVPFARTAFGVALRVAVVLAVVAGVIVVA